MKKRVMSIGITAAMLFAMIPGSVMAAGDVAINATNFPDAKFREVVSEKDTDSNGLLSEAEIATTRSINCYEMGIGSLKGIEYFTSVSYLNCYGNDLTELNVSALTNLTELVCADNKITTLDVSANKKLEVLQCAGNQLTSIALDNPELWRFICSDNNLTNLDLSKTPGLACLRAERNKLTSLDISKNEELLYTLDLNIVHEEDGVVYYNLGSEQQNIFVDKTVKIITEEETGAEGFVERLYSIALGRQSDANGKNSWVAALQNGDTGADAAKGFLFSDEFLNKDMSNEEFVKILYQTFFNREADASGLAGWVAAIENGQSKQDVIMGFIDSTEWANVCVGYGILSGGTGVPSIEVEPNEQVISFATRLYSTCLKRTPDQNGLNAWATQLANLRDSGSNAARGFFFSEEMNNNPVSNEEFVTRLYLTFMDRNPDEGGFNAWVGQLNSGAATREEVFDGFAQSKEFGTICTNYGIIR